MHAPFHVLIWFLSKFGPTATEQLLGSSLPWNLELLRHDESRQSQGLDPLVDPSARFQYRALCYRYITARLGHAVAKATVMRPLALPLLSLPPHTDRSSLSPGISLARLIRSFFPLSPLSFVILFLPPSLNLNLSISLPLSLHLSFPLSFPLSYSFTLVEAQFFSHPELCLTFAHSVIKFYSSEHTST